MNDAADSSRTFIKICGITSIELAQTAIEAGADAIGLVFAPDSPRCIDRELGLQIASTLPDHVAPIGMFQDPSLEDITGENGWPHPWVQLHGTEDEAFIELIEGHRVLRGFRFDPEQVMRWDACPGIEVLVIDGSAGGEGTAFEHERLVEMMPDLTKPVMLAGGLTPDNVAAAIASVRPYGIDVSSGVESARGVKDPDLIRAFCAAVRATDE